MIEVVDLTSGRDDGAVIAARILPCTKQTWCILHRDHDGPCDEKPRAPQTPTDYGPKRPKAKS